MLPIKSWRVFYADGSTFDSTQGSWADAPPFGVVCVVYYHTPPFKDLHVEANDESLYYFQGEGDNADVKMGLWMDDEGFYRILDLARKSSEPL
jgi:hypothetical protein